MAQVIREDERCLVCRAESTGLWGGLFLAGLGIAIAAGLIHGRDFHPGSLSDRLSEIMIGVIAVVLAFVVAGPEDLVVDFTTRTYRVRTGLLFLAGWRSGSLAELDRLELRKRRAGTAWRISLAWEDPRRRLFDLAVLKDTGGEAEDPRLHARQRMQHYADRLGIPAIDETGVALTPGSAGGVGGRDALHTSHTSYTAPPPAAPTLDSRSPVEATTRRYRLSGTDRRLTLAKSRWFVLEGDWQMLLWAIIAGPTLAYILFNSRRAITGFALDVLKMGRQAVLELMHRTAAAPADPQERAMRVMMVFAGGAILLLVVLALAAWLRLLRAVLKVTIGETHVFDLDRDRLSFNGRTLARVTEIRGVDVREHVRTQRSGSRTWHQVSVSTENGSRIPVAWGDPAELARLGAAIGGWLGVEAVAS